MVLKRLNQPIYLLLFAILLAPALTFAAVPRWEIVKNESQLNFTGTQNNAPILATFKNFNGEIYFDPQQLNASRVRVVVDTNSLAAPYSDLVNTLKSKDWLDVNRFPQATFVANQIKKTGNNTYQVDGLLTIRDKQRPISAQFILEEYSAHKARAKGTIAFQRTHFGLGQGQWANTSQIKDPVQVNFVISAIRKP